MTEVAGVPASLLPVLVVLVPILAAAIPPVLERWWDGVGSVVALAATAINVVVAGALAWTTFDTGGTINTEIADYAPDDGGIELAVDGLGVLVVALIAIVGFAVIAASRDERRRGTFYSLYLLLVGGLSGVAVTGDVFNMYVFLEISGLAAYALIASDGTGRSALAALKYLIVGTVGASLYLIGVGYAYVATGVLNMAQLATEFASLGYSNTLVIAAFAFMASGFAIKIALFPVHTWQPDAYTEAPDRMTALIAALVSTTAAYALARVTYSVFTVEFFVVNPIVRDALLYVGAISVIAGSVLAVLQREVKRMLAYSSVSQFGLIVVGFALFTDEAFVGSIVHLVGHGIIKGALFLGVALFVATMGARTVDDYDGLADRAPYASAAFAVLALALVGVPPTVGFVGKLYIALGAVEAEAWLPVAVIVASTVLTLGYVLRLLERMYFTAPSEPALEGAAAADGGTSPRTADGSGSPDATDGGTTADADHDATGDVTRRKSSHRAPLVVLVIAALVAVALGFAGAWFESLLRPTVDALLQR